MKTTLTIIIPFLNEGEEIRNTLTSIRDTAEGQPDIILINDSSTDGYDYPGVAREFGCQYISHTQRMGVANSRNEGVDQTKTPYFLLLDGHMRFYEKGWDVRVAELLKKYPKAVLCGRSKVLRMNEADEVVDAEEPRTYGAYIQFQPERIFSAAWNYTDGHPYTNLLEIPCILGAAYAMSKGYWEQLRGLEGLVTYGTDEELLSIKVWCEGGTCLLVKDWIAGHIYRNRFPYEVRSKEVVYNKLYTIELLLPYPEKASLFYQMKHLYGETFDDAYALLKQNYGQVREMKQYLQKTATRNINDFLRFNASVLEKNQGNRKEAGR